MKHHRFIIDDKATSIESDSSWLASASTSGSSRHKRWALIGIATAMLASLILVAPKIPAAAGAPKSSLRDGAAAPWEKTAGPPGLQTNVIFESNNIVYAGTETQGVYKSTDNGSSWVPANAGIERASISDIIASGPNLLAAATSSLPRLLKHIQIHR